MDGPVAADSIAYHELVESALSKGEKLTVAGQMLFMAIDVLPWRSKSIAKPFVKTDMPT